MSGVHARPLFDLMGLDSAPPMQHCLGPEHLDRYWCGAPRPPEKPIEWGPVECVVCADLYRINGPWWLSERWL